MKYLVITIAVLLLVGYLLLWYGMKPARHRLPAQGEFKKFLETLLYSGYDGGFLIIEAPTKERFIQFLKYIKSKGNVGLQFDFPRAPWSESYFETLKEVLDQQGYEYSIEIPDPLYSTPGNLVTEFIVVDLNQNMELASELTRLCLLQVFKLRPDEIVTLYFVDVSPKEEKIGF